MTTRRRGIATERSDVVVIIERAPPSPAQAEAWRRLWWWLLGPEKNNAPTGEVEASACGPVERLDHEEMKQNYVNIP